MSDDDGHTDRATLLGTMQLVLAFAFGMTCGIMMGQGMP